MCKEAEARYRIRQSGGEQHSDKGPRVLALNSPHLWPLQSSFFLRDILTIFITAPFLALEIGNGFKKVNSTKIRPEPSGDNDLCIGDLPEQEI